jgi:4a-hydroxytetrahydrobiopterin dehydratase
MRELANLDHLRFPARNTLSPKERQKKYTFKSFMPAIGFVNKIADAAEKAGHHPDITINYSLVTISLSTHSEGGVTDKDFQLAQEIDQIAATAT